MFTEMLTDNVKGGQATRVMQMQPDLICIYSSHISLTVTHIFIGSVCPDQRPIQARLHIVDLLIILNKYKQHLDQLELSTDPT